MANWKEGDVYICRKASYGQACIDQYIFVGIRHFLMGVYTDFCITLLTLLFLRGKTRHWYTRAIKECDSLIFEVGFNKCYITQFENLLIADFKFYNGKAGATETKQAFISGIQDGSCNSIVGYCIFYLLF